MTVVLGYLVLDLLALVLLIWALVHEVHGARFARRYSALADRWARLGYPEEAARARRAAAWYRLPWWRALFAEKE